MRPLLAACRQKRAGPARLRSQPTLATPCRSASKGLASSARGVLRPGRLLAPALRAERRLAHERGEQEKAVAAARPAAASCRSLQLFPLKWGQGAPAGPAASGRLAK